MEYKSHFSKHYSYYYIAMVVAELSIGTRKGAPGDGGSSFDAVVIVGDGVAGGDATSVETDDKNGSSHSPNSSQSSFTIDRLQKNLNDYFIYRARVARSLFMRELIILCYSSSSSSLFSSMLSPSPLSCDHSANAL